jgi:hypothetical protein
MKFTQDTAKKAVQDFIKKHGREPLPRDYTKENGLPSRRYIERNFGGLPAFRRFNDLEVTDYNKGIVRSETARTSMLRSKKYEIELYKKLYKKYHDPEDFKVVVYREFCYQQYSEDGVYSHNVRTDVVIADRIKNHYVFIDFFYPSEEYSFYGCVASKTRKLKNSPVLLDGATHEVLFVCVNDVFSKSYKTDIAEVLSLSDLLTRFPLQ